jgi:hypothetical protein
MDLGSQAGLRSFSEGACPGLTAVAHRLDWRRKLAAPIEIRASKELVLE